MGLNHDKLVQEWSNSVSNKVSPGKTPSVNLTGSEESDVEENNDPNESTAEHGDEELIPDAVNNVTNAPSSDRSVVIIGDNWDKNINPRCMRSDNQVKSLHLFHSVATFSRMNTMHLDDSKPLGSLSKVSLSEFLPSLDDCTSVRDNFVTLAARIVVENLSHFSYLQPCVPSHIPHEFSSAMEEKTLYVSF